MEYQDYLAFLAELIGQLEQLSDIEQDKVIAVRAHDLDALDSCMKREQALSLVLRGSERRRQELLSSLGLEGIPLRQMPQHCPPEYRSETARLVEGVLRTLEVAQSAQAPARVLLESQLRLVEEELHKRGAEAVPLPRDAYPSAGHGGAEHPTYTDIKA